MPEEEVIMSEQDAIKQIQTIAESEKVNTDLLIKINTDLQNINSNISSINDYYVIQKIQKEKKENEQKAEANSKQDEQETKQDQETRSEESEDITLETVYNELQTTNEHLTNLETLQIVGIFSQGILIGVVLFTIFWRRFFS